MNLGVITYYYPPDLSAGSFRSMGFVESLLKLKIEDISITVICSEPNRYASYKAAQKELIKHKSLKIIRVKNILSNNYRIFRFFNYIFFFISSFLIVKKYNIKYIFGTSSRLFTALNVYLISVLFNIKYFIDIRDTFVLNIYEIYLKKNKFFKPILYPLNFFENIILGRASGINFVSKGFHKYFKNYLSKESKLYYFTNGIDKIFLDNTITKSNKIKKNKKINILYAGNIGAGQGLDKLLPDLALKNKSKFFITVIGDGSKRNQLLNKIRINKIKNIKISPPIHRDKLIEEYKKADVLLLQLNKYDSLNLTIPSKIFEYGSLGKPIVAGVSGYTEKFIKKNLSYSITFKSNDVFSCTNAINKSIKLKIMNKDVKLFRSKFSRMSIMENMAKKVILALG